MNIAIVDDDQYYLKKIRNMLSNVHHSFHIECFHDGRDFLKKAQLFDYVCLDIEMEQIDGIELSKQLSLFPIKIIFITQHPKRMIDAFGINVVKFILKDHLDEIIDFFQHEINNQSIGVVCLLTYIFILIYIKNNNEKIVLQQINSSLAMLDIYSKEIIECNKNIKEIRHNIKDQIHVIEKLISQSQHQQAHYLLNHINDTLDKTITDVYTSNLVIDAYFHYVIHNEKEYQFMIDSNCISGFHMKNEDLLLVIVNLVNNAYQNALKNSTISIKISLYEESLTLKISNYIGDQEDREGEHGLGLLIVNSIVSKYKGEFISSIENNIYNVYVSLGGKL